MTAHTDLMAYVARESDEEQAQFAALLAARDAETLREGADAMEAEARTFGGGHGMCGQALRGGADLLRRMAAGRAEQPAPVALPRRGDAVEQWLFRQRAAFVADAAPWLALDEVLDTYRLHADTGTPLDETPEPANITKENER